MKKIFLTLCWVLGTFAYAMAQTHDTIGTLVPKVIIITHAGVTYTDSIPNALAGKNYTLAYAGNNGNGLDFYTSSVDGMPVAKADKNFRSNMPVKKENMPGNLNKLKEMLEQNKKQPQENKNGTQFHFKINYPGKTLITTDSLSLYKPFIAKH
jgi:hypothetical protein